MNKIVRLYASKLNHIETVTNDTTWNDFYMMMLNIHGLDSAAHALHVQSMRFRVVDESKFSLFMLKYSDVIVRISYE
jgi:hypothetical protein